jgi:hypothetical protein
MKAHVVQVVLHDIKAQLLMYFRKKEKKEKRINIKISISVLAGLSGMKFLCDNMQNPNDTNAAWLFRFINNTIIKWNS